jgi:hypothetical protein
MSVDVLVDKLLVLRGTTTKRLATVLLSGQPCWDTDQKALYVGDGTTFGGISVGGGSSSSTLTLVAGESLDSPRIVAAADGIAYYPDLSNNDDIQRVIGVTTHAATQGAMVSVAPQASFTEPMWSWSPGPVYCSESDGRLTQTYAASAVLEVGKALDANTVTVLIHRAILRA